MAYFSNGTEGNAEMERLCVHCVHYEDCPIILLHLMWNYEQVSDETKHAALNTLWPENEQHNGDCAMFAPEFSVLDYRETLDEIVSIIDRQIDEMENV